MISCKTEIKKKKTTKTNNTIPIQTEGHWVWVQGKGGLELSNRFRISAFYL